MKLIQAKRPGHNDEVEVALKNYYNFNYVGQIMAGNPPQAFNAIFDTGSTNFWVLSTLCEGDRINNGLNNAFDPDQSSTFEPTSLACQVEFGSGSLQGFFAKDEIQVGIARMDPSGQMHDMIKVKKQIFGVITKEQVLDDTFDCIVGLAYPMMANSADLKGLPLFDSMIEQKLLNQNLFAFYMSLCNEEKSELAFGWYDTQKYTGPLTWHPVIYRYFWALQLDDIKFNGKALNICKGKKCQVTPDSGTSTITFPNWAYRQVYRQGYLQTRRNCQSDKVFGTLTFVINGIDYTIESNHFMEVTDTSQSILSLQKVLEYDDSFTCQTSISPLDISMKGVENLFIVGDMFMSLFYCIFDRDNDRVGIAKAVHNCESEDGYPWPGAND